MHFLQRVKNETSTAFVAGKSQLNGLCGVFSVKAKYSGSQSRKYTHPHSTESILLKLQIVRNFHSTNGSAGSIGSILSSMGTKIPTPTCPILHRNVSYTNVPVPSMGDSISEGSLNHWKIKSGDPVVSGDVVAVIDTDKVSVDVNSPVTGVIHKLNAAAGDTVYIGHCLFVVDVDADSVKKNVSTEAPVAPNTSSNPVVGSNITVQATEKGEKPAPKAKAVEAETQTSPNRSKPHQPAPVGSQSSVMEKSSPVNSVGESRVPMSRMRLRIAERLKSAQNTAAMLTTFNECDMGNLMALRSEMNEAFQAKHGVKMGFVSAFLLASAKSLRNFPEVNAVIEDKDIVYKNHIDISVAVATATGLLVPVVRQCDKKSWADLEKELADLASRARKSQVALEDMIGGTFTISNGGVYGSMMGTPILNPPQSSILGMHAVTKRPVVRGSEIVIRPVMYLALTYDHRLIDGREAVMFLSSIRHYIEDPRKIFLDL